MNCSACRARIGPLADGELSSRDERLVQAHLARCADCRAFSERLSLVDSSLLRLAPIEPRADFTIAVMAGIAAMPTPARQPARLWWLVVADVALWLALGALTALGAIRWKIAAAAAGAFAAKIGVAADSLYEVARDFHVTGVVWAGAAVEVLFLVIFVVVGRRYLPHLRSTLSGVLS